MNNDLTRTKEEIAELPADDPLAEWYNDDWSPTDMTGADLKNLAASHTELEKVLQAANIEMLPDGSHQFKPRAVKYYCGEITQQRIDQLEKQNRELVEALREISHPIEFMQKRLEPEQRLHGIMAVKLSDDPEYLKRIARAVLDKINDKI